MKQTIGIAALIVTALTAGSGAAATINTMIGDDDCFGYSSLASCADGTLIPGVQVVDNRTASDPAGTDRFGPLGTLSFVFNIDLTNATATSAVVSVKTAGIDLGTTAFGDKIAGTRFSFNGSALGAFFLNATVVGTEASTRGIATYSFGILAGLKNGDNTLELVPEEGFEQFNLFELYAVAVPQGGQLDQMAGNAITVTEKATGGGQPFDIRQPFLTMRYCVVMAGIFPQRN